MTAWIAAGPWTANRFSVEDRRLRRSVTNDEPDEPDEPDEGNEKKPEKWFYCR